MGEKLKNPPLIEALCQFVFPDLSAWDETIPDQLHERIKDEFPDRSEVHRPELEIPLLKGTQVIGSLTGTDITQLKRKDETAIAQVGKNILIVNHLGPYPQWESFRDLVAGIFREYGEVAQPGEPLMSIGLRYINRIGHPDLDFKIGDFLNENPPIEWSEGSPIGKFYQHYELVTDSPPGVLIHKTGLNVSDGTRWIILDLDFSSIYVGGITWWDTKELVSWLNGAHDQICKAFVASLNPELYERMKRGEN